jgi:hypothetical protein
LHGLDDHITCQRCVAQPGRECSCRLPAQLCVCVRLRVHSRGAVSCQLALRHASQLLEARDVLYHAHRGSAPDTINGRSSSAETYTLCTQQTWPGHASIHPFPRISLHAHTQTTVIVSTLYRTRCLTRRSRQDEATTKSDEQPKNGWTQQCHARG